MLGSSMSRFVPAFKSPNPDVIKKFIDKVADIDRMLVLTGAGVSTESGIPDYRSEKIGLFERSNHRPITIQEFVQSEPARKRAGSSLLTELHGCGHRVKCMNCGDLTKREDHQSRMEELNSEWMKANVAGEMAPDGDVQLEEGAHESFVLPSCEKCGGILKTDVVFFGDNVSREDVDSCYEKVETCTGVLVLGSSLTVMSGFRFAYHASLMGKPVLIVNIGPTRADSFANMKISAPVTEIVTKL